MVTPAHLTEKLNQFSSEILGIPKHEIESDSNSFTLDLKPIDQTTTFKVVLPLVINVAIASVKVKVHLEGATISTIEGGEVGQIINLKRYTSQSLSLTRSDFLKLSSLITLEDSQLLDNITLQKIEPTIWVELARKKFTE